MSIDANADVSMRQYVEKVVSLPGAKVRQLCESNYLLAANVLTYNWVEGNPNSTWDGKPFDWHPVASADGRHHFKDWYDRIRSNAANMFLAARKHTKTTFCDTLIIWRSEYNSGHASLYWANTRDQVKDRMEELDEIAKANPWLENVTADTAALSKTYPNGAKVDTAWVSGAYEGGHVDLQIGDDPMKELGDIPDREVEHWYGNVIVPTLNPGNTLQCIVGTRKRPNDLYEILRRRHEEEGFGDKIPGYSLVEYPAVRELWEEEYDRPGDLAPMEVYEEVHAPDLADAFDLETDTLHLLWPDARPADFLLSNLGMQGRRYFLREFAMVYTQVEDAVVRRAWIDANSANVAPPTVLSDPFDAVGRPEPVTRSDFERVVTGIDPAGEGRDRFGFVTVGVLRHGEGDDAPRRRHVLNVYQEQDLPPSKFRAKLEALHDRYHPDVMALEANLNQTWVAGDEEIPRRVRSALETVATTRGKHSWKEGVPRIGSDIETGTYQFYTGGADNQTENLITALTSVQMHEGELQGHTPDLVMALYMVQKVLGGGGAGSSRASIGGRTAGMSDERAEREREKEEALEDSPFASALSDAMSSGSDYY